MWMADPADCQINVVEQRCKAVPCLICRCAHCRNFGEPDDDEMGRLGGLNIIEVGAAGRAVPTSSCLLFYKKYKF